MLGSPDEVARRGSRLYVVDSVKTAAGVKSGGPVSSTTGGRRDRQDSTTPHPAEPVTAWAKQANSPASQAGVCPGNASGQRREPTRGKREFARSGRRTPPHATRWAWSVFTRPQADPLADPCLVLSVLSARRRRSVPKDREDTKSRRLHTPHPPGLQDHLGHSHLVVTLNDSSTRLFALQNAHAAQRAGSPPRRPPKRTTTTSSLQRHTTHRRWTESSQRRSLRRQLPKRSVGTATGRTPSRHTTAPETAAAVRLTPRK